MFLLIGLRFFWHFECLMYTDDTVHWQYSRVQRPHSTMRVQQIALTTLYNNSTLNKFNTDSTALSPPLDIKEIFKKKFYQHYPPPVRNMLTRPQQDSILVALMYCLHWNHLEPQEEVNMLQTKKYRIVLPFLLLCGLTRIYMYINHCTALTSVCNTNTCTQISENHDSVYCVQQSCNKNGVQWLECKAISRCQHTAYITESPHCCCTDLHKATVDPSKGQSFSPGILWALWSVLVVHAQLWVIILPLFVGVIALSRYSGKKKVSLVPGRNYCVQRKFHGCHFTPTVKVLDVISFLNQSNIEILANISILILS